MRRYALWFGTFLIVVLQAEGMPRQSRETSAQKAIADVEMRWLQHIDDPGALQSILADDFIHVLPSGLITKQQHIEFVKAHRRSPQEHRSFESLTVRVYGETGIANGIVTITDASGTHRSVFTDVFVKRNDGWQAVNAQENPAQAQH